MWCPVSTAHLSTYTCTNIIVLDVCVCVQRVVPPPLSAGWDAALAWTFGLVTTWKSGILCLLTNTLSLCVFNKIFVFRKDNKNNRNLPTFRTNLSFDIQFPNYNLANSVGAEVCVTILRTVLKQPWFLSFINLNMTDSLVVTKQPICFIRSKANCRSSCDRDSEQSATTCTSRPSERKSIAVCSTQMWA